MGDIIDMLFNKTNPDIMSQVNQKSVLDKLAQRARIYGKQASKALNKEVVSKANIKDILGKAKTGAKGYVGGPWGAAVRVGSGIIGAGELKDAAEKAKAGNKAGALYQGTLGTIDTLGAIGPAKLSPYYWAAQVGALPARIIEWKKLQDIDKTFGSGAYNENLVVDTLKDDNNMMNDLVEAGYASIDPKTGIVTLSPEFYAALGRDKNGVKINREQHIAAENNSKGGGTTPPVNDYGVVGSTGNFINSLTGQNANNQPEASTINPTETSPQNEQSISGIDLSAVNGQYDAANQDYLNKLIEFAKNYQQNATNDNRRNLALAMIAKGTHNPYLMQTGKLDKNKQMFDQLKIEEAIKEAQLKPIERAQAAMAYAKAGLPAELAYLSDKSLVPFANMYKTDMTRQNVLDQIAARNELQRYINEGRWAIQQMEEEGRNRRQYNDQQFKTSDPYVWSKILSNPGYLYPELPPETQQKIINYIVGGFNGNPQADAKTVAKQNVLSKLGVQQGNTNNNTPTQIIPELEVNR